MLVKNKIGQSFMMACVVMALTSTINAATINYTWGVGGDWFEGSPISQFWLQGDQSRGGYTVLGMVMHEYDLDCGVDPTTIRFLEDLWLVEGYNIIGEDIDSPEEAAPLTIVGELGALHPSVQHVDPPNTDFDTMCTTLINTEKMYIFFWYAGYGDGATEDACVLLFVGAPTLGSDLVQKDLDDITVSNTWTPVPEPTTGFLTLIGIGLLGIRRRSKMA